jgi:hypothetical protein
MGALASDFLTSGLIIVFHQYWWSVAAVMISLFGWILALRGVVLMASPNLHEQAAMSVSNVIGSVAAEGDRTTRHIACQRLRGERHLVPELVDGDEPVASSRKVGVSQFSYQSEDRISPIRLSNTRAVAQAKSWSRF